MSNHCSFGNQRWFICVAKQRCLILWRRLILRLWLQQKMCVFVLELGHRYLELFVLVIDSIMYFLVYLRLLSPHTLPHPRWRWDFTLVSVLVTRWLLEQSIYFQELVFTTCSRVVRLAIVLSVWALVDAALHPWAIACLVIRDTNLVFSLSVDCIGVAFVLTCNVHTTCLVCGSVTL